ncbi:tRNA uridine-5-carboxymethylaminomethyl(34) synthesis enzyme MnmG [Mycoplasmoides pneumoniae]|uniref:tRNA uridine-5-carboxymethylaminomethyl(34) synthesis enzyme MnmG n=1 Tax=Mycoplasmoides pneumoniae TaxID=2104 RepID=UPI000A2A15EA|nr:tRNA uridine-5-carboxymethylaminomethyl(34) synthesis enzyme MnmG [Mycoplasmoides pneumoniae]ARQ35425.1 tRNA uridine-5-carboxymethylaminomethyl(34) synthesis enzyme MnmG [Mycoplasmoides pneumoniae]
MSFTLTVIGGGHAGLEAAFIASKLGLKVNLLVLDPNHVGSCPCNPAIGGPAKGIVTREIDVLGGMQGKAADATALQYKLLNSSKGPAVQAIRAQIDKIAYQKWFRQQIDQTPNIELIAGEAVDILESNGKVKGVVLADGSELASDAVIVTTGTYLKAKTYCGSLSKEEGPDRAKRSEYLSTNLIKRGFKTLRLKTGTPPRILRESLDFSQMAVEANTTPHLAFSFTTKNYLPLEQQVICHLIHTNPQIHQLILANLKQSAVFNGSIKANGPLYCPSIEDKVFRFQDKERHQIFVEPESLSLETVYLAGFSTSFPPEVQEHIVRLLPGFKNARFQKYGYAIEYDAFSSIQLKSTLETKLIQNLYFAGQINGTSGYEEAAGQGLIAGINAALKPQRKPEFVLQRNEAYLGVMINDLVTKEISDPYRLLTSRAEHRLWLRNDNLQERLIEKSRALGLVEADVYANYLEQQQKKKQLIDYLQTTTVGQIAALKLNFKNTAQTLFDFTKRAEIKLVDLVQLLPKRFDLDVQSLNQIDIDIKYAGYIKKSEKYFKSLNNLSSVKIPLKLNYHKVPNLASEAIVKLSKIRPTDLSVASQVAGINFNDILAIKHFLDNHE